MEYRNTTFCQQVFEGAVRDQEEVVAALDTWQAYVIFFCLALFCSGVAKLFNLVRKKIYRDKDNLDTDFDAGGKVSLGLTATTIVSQWTWAATLLQSSAVAANYGISGPFWYASGASIQIILFSMLSVQLKIKAPGAKTFLQVIRARFKSRTHIVFVVFALATNVIVTAMLMLGGIAVVTRLVPGLSVELTAGMIATVMGIYTFIGGLGATFYVSYFNTLLIYVIMIVFLVKVYHDPSGGGELGSVDSVYQYVSCAVADEGNKDQSYLTMFSYQGFVFGIINIVGNFGTVFVDQSYWQSSVAARPREGVWGFLSGGLSWFAVPFTFATTMGLAYIAFNVKNGEPLLTSDEVGSGLVAPVVAHKLMGKPGEVLMLILILMAVTSTGSAEIMAVVSILVYDIYQLYLKPYRLVHDANTCILCGRQRGRNANPRDKCHCISMTSCPDCNYDDENRSICKRALKPVFKCKTHGTYRTYNELLLGHKNWCILFVTISIIPLTILLDALEVNLGWLYMFMGILIGSAVIPITLCLCWSRLTGVAMQAGATSGTLTGLLAWIIMSSQHEAGLGDFFTSTGDEISMLVGNLVSILFGGLVTVIVTLVTNRHYDASMKPEIWENTRDIDSPLSPWTELYARDLGLIRANKLDNKPPIEDVEMTFKGAKRTAVIGALGLTILLIIVWPALMLVEGVMDSDSFTHWVNASTAWGILAAIYIIIMPLVSEGWQLAGVLKQKHSLIGTENSLSRSQSLQQIETVDKNEHLHSTRKSSTQPEQVVHDTPAVSGGNNFSPESSVAHDSVF